MQDLAEKIRLLTPEQQQLIGELVEMLSRSSMAPRLPRLNWVGKAQEIAPHMDSVELQHLISKWRCEPHS
jgi:DNA replication initiation complex subunit (GINS family)